VISAGIPPLATASTQRDRIEAALVGAGYAVTDDGPGGASLTIHGLNQRDAVELETVDSGEALATLSHSHCGHGEVFFTSTTRGVVPATKVDAHVIGSGMPGPVTNALRSAYMAKARAQSA
jgi:hypothetical protein